MSVDMTDFDFNNAMDFAVIEEMDKPFPSGEYAYEIKKAEAGRSKTKQSPQISLTVEIQDEDGSKRTVWDVLSFDATNNPVGYKITGAKLRQLFGDEVDDTDFGDMDNYIGLEGIALVDVQEGNGVNPTTNEPYPPRNRINKYNVDAEPLDLDNM